MKKAKLTQWVLWTPGRKGNQCVVWAPNEILAIEEAILQVGFCANDWSTMAMKATSKKYQDKILAESIILEATSDKLQAKAASI